jgi:hypothetical protein
VKDLRIVINVLENMRGRGSDFITAVTPLIEHLSKRTTGLKVLITSGPADYSRMTLGGLPCIRILYDKERKGLIVVS